MPPHDVGQSPAGLSGLPVTEAAAYLGLSVNAVRHRIRRGSLPACKVNGEWRVMVVDDARPGQAGQLRIGEATDSPPDTPEDSPAASPAMSALDAGQRQLEILRDTLLAPLIEQSERQQARLEEQAEQIGRLSAERDAARQELAAAEQRIERLRAAIEGQTTARPWWKFW